MAQNSYYFGDDYDPRDELAEIFGSPVLPFGEPQPEAIRWAQKIIREKQPASETETIPLLREAEPRLSQQTATYLAWQA